METGVLQRDSRVWLHPKRRLACPLRRLPMKPNGPRQRRRMDVPRRGTLLRSDQYANCAKRHSVSSSEAKPWALYLTRIRVNAQEEKRKHGITCHTSSPLEKGRAEGAGWMCLEEAPFYAAVSMATVQSATPYRQRKRSREIFAALVCEVTSGLRNESTVLHMIRVAPWRRGAPKAQDGSPKWYKRQWSGKGLVASDLNAVFGHRHHHSSLESRALIFHQRAIRPLGGH